MFSYAKKRKLSLSKREFVEEAKTGLIPPLYVELPWAGPHELYPKFAGRGSALLESVKGPQRIARYSFISFAPYAVFKVKDSVCELEAGGRRAVSMKKKAKPLERLKCLVDAYRQRPIEGLPPFQGGAVGLISYDFAHYLEKITAEAVKRPADDIFIPDACFFMTDRLVAFDHAEGRAWLVFCPGARDTGLGYGDISGLDWGEKYDEAEAEISRLLDKLLSEPSPLEDVPAADIIPEHELSKEQYMDMVARAKEYIRAGDIFQANLSLRLRARIGKTHPWRIYCALREINPSPFACFLDFGDYFIVSSSPERLIKTDTRSVETRPIAGTRPRGRDVHEDALMRRELLLNEKEKAEHIMLIDLERNDLGKVSDYGSVMVDELMSTEDYSHVMHIVSNIKGRLANGRTMFDCIKAAFPGGTITGVPKVRCMQIINELEPLRRGPYTGSIGYLGFSGHMDLNIVIRSFLIKNETAYVQAGAGIVADSEPEREYLESLRKAEALLVTLRVVKNGGFLYNIKAEGR